MLLTLQRRAGNRAVSAIVQRAAGDVGHEQGQAEHAVSGESSVGTVSVSGLTQAQYTHRWDNGPITHQPAEDCDGDCPERYPCSTASAEKVATYGVTTNVSLPSANIPGLPECERGVLAQWIRNVLEPHEQRHVSAYEHYGGTTRKRFTATGCRDEVAGMLEEQMQTDHDTEEPARRAASDRESADLDPFRASIDFSSCEADEDQGE